MDCEEKRTEVEKQFDLEKAKESLRDLSDYISTTGFLSCCITEISSTKIMIDILIERLGLEIESIKESKKS